MSTSKLPLLNDANFANNVAKGVSVIDVFADWCGPCKQMAPKFQKLADEFSGGGVKFYKLDLDDEATSGVVETLEITSIPTFLVYKDAELVETIVGAVPARKIQKAIESALE